MSDHAVALKGAHKRLNAALVGQTLVAAGLNLRPECVAEGLKSVIWPARFQHTAVGNRKFILDGPEGSACNSLPSSALPRLDISSTRLNSRCRKIFTEGDCMKIDYSTIEPLEARIAPSIFVVSSLADSGAGTLRDAIAKADTHTGADTIIFHLPAPAAHSENIITLASTLTVDPITPGDKLTITGPGAGKLIVNGNNAVQAFYLGGPDTTDNPVTISGLSILNGKFAAGGAILSNESLTLNNVIASGNTVTNVGGAIFVVGGPHVSISNSRITGNHADNDGGGIFILQATSIAITNTVVSGNSAVNVAGGAELGVNGVGTGITVSKSTFSGNTSAETGGLFVYDRNTSPNSQIVISSSVITGNTAGTTNPNGAGGLYISTGNTVLTGTVVEGNSAVVEGGGIFANRPTSLVISKCTISGNRVTGAPGGGGQVVEGGGGLLISGAGGTTPANVQITGSRIADNTCNGEGGGIFASNGLSLTLSACTVSGNFADEGGGGIFAVGTGAGKVDLAVTGSLVSGNHGNGGGGIDASGSGALTVTASKITGNASEDSGGGILAQSSGAPVVIKGCSVSNNTAIYGGGIAALSTPSFTVSGGSITGNTATDYGGGIYTVDTTGNITGVTISGNIAATDGGGVFKGLGTIPSVITVQAAKVTGNVAPTGPDIFGTITVV